jgi:D-alanine-D-alanine ligase
MRKLNVAVIFGGKSGEHEVSLTSANNIISSLNRNKYNLTLIGIDKSGKWHLQEDGKHLLNEDDPKNISLNKSNIEVMISPSNEKENLVIIENDKISRRKIDVIIPVLHGPYGEDGTIQGLFEIAGIPYIGCDPLGGTVGMDKDVMKRLLNEAGIPIPKFKIFNIVDKRNCTVSFSETKKVLGTPMFVKPANLGSSVGIRKVSDESSFNEAINEAFKFDTKIIVEEGIDGREIECAVLGNEEPRASVPGEIIPTNDFYSYDAKYIDANGAKLQAPAKLTDVETKKMQELSIKAYKVLCANGLSRLDFFLTKDGKFLCNEINTFPGFTKISMYPKLWELSGVKYSELLDELINYGIARFKNKNDLLVSPE